MIMFSPVFILTLATLGLASSDQVLDLIPSLYQTNSDTPTWTSSHWMTGGTRTLDYTSTTDSQDSSGLSQRRGSKDATIVISDGVMQMGGTQVRLYLNPWIKEDGTHWTAAEDEERRSNGINPTRFYLNTEITVYYRRSGTDGKNGGGLVVGCRTSPNGHSKPETNYLYTHTYYARFRHDGLVDFVKEMTHPTAEYYWDGKVHKHGVLFSDGKLPSDTWLGMKFVVYNLDSTRVKLELYIDETSGGSVEKISSISNWKLVGDMVDDGTNFVVETEGQVDGAKAITRGGGVVFIRNTEVKKAEYKYLVVKEIIPPV